MSVGGIRGGGVAEVVHKGQPVPKRGGIPYSVWCRREEFIGKKKSLPEGSLGPQ